MAEKQTFRAQVVALNALGESGYRRMAGTQGPEITLSINGGLCTLPVDSETMLWAGKNIGKWFSIELTELVP